MRDPSAYAAAGRKDPLTDEQRRDHPYDFVSLPDKPKKLEAPGHDLYQPDRLSGSLRLTYRVLQPLHVGSGVFETAAECGLDGGSVPVRGIARRQGKPVLPGSSWKGAVRSRYEAITRSRLGLSASGGKMRFEKLPEPLQDGPGMHEVKIEDPRVSRRGPLDPATVRGPHDLRNLSPAEALFGAMGYRGRIRPGDGEIELPPGAATPAQPLRVAPLESPAIHRLAKPGCARKAGRNRVVISEVEGRKFYYDGDVVASRVRDSDGRRDEVFEEVDFVPAGSRIVLAVRLDNVTLAEVGALLLSAGYERETGVSRFGGYQPCGLGKVELQEVSGELAPGSSVRKWRRPRREPLDPQRAVAEAHRELIDREALVELKTVTTRRRP